MLHTSVLCDGALPWPLCPLSALQVQFVVETLSLAFTALHHTAAHSAFTPTLIYDMKERLPLFRIAVDRLKQFISNSLHPALIPISILSLKNRFSLGELQDLVEQKFCLGIKEIVCASDVESEIAKSATNTRGSQQCFRQISHQVPANLTQISYFCAHMFILPESFCKFSSAH